MVTKTLGINDGHTKSGAGSGAVGRINESEHTRLVGSEVRRLFKENGQHVVDCTIDYASSTSENLSLIVAQANRQDLDWFISIHFNAGGGKGVEVYTYEGRQYEDAVAVCKNIADLGFTNRGVKSGTGLYVIKKTKAKSMLIEVCFVDTEDADKYLSIGHTKIAEAIVKGVIGVISQPTVPSEPIKPVQPEQTPTPSQPDNITIARNYLKTPHQTGLVQRILNCLGYNLVTDSDCGSATTKAIGDFQTKYNLGTDYKFGTKCFSKAYEIIKSKLLVNGSKGNEVKLLQFILGISDDGIFGSQTEKAVREYQKSKGLSVDGKVGQQSWKNLLKA